METVQKINFFAAHQWEPEMNATNVFLKTPLGLREVSERNRKLPSKVRTMLVLIDGHKAETELRKDAQQIGAPDDFLEQLLAVELIMKESVTLVAANDAISDGPVAATAPAPDEYMRFRAAKDFMNVSVVDAMGIRAFFFTLKLERAGTLADLRTLETSYETAIRKASGEEVAYVLAKRLRELLNEEHRRGNTAGLAERR